LTFGQKCDILFTEREGNSMTRAKKIEMKKEIIKYWYLNIRARGYIILNEGDVEKLTLKIHYQTNYPKAKIKKYFWENVYTDKDFINDYEC
jgi:hypothetical protein